jgi:hypothetical protein
VSEPNDAEPPSRVSLSLGEALVLLAVLEDARDAVTESGHLTIVVGLEDLIRMLSRRLGFDDPPGGADAR